MPADLATLRRALPLLDEVLDAPRDRRQEVIARLAGEDRALARELELAAAAAESPVPDLDGGVGAVAPDLLDELTEVRLVGRCFGPWRVVEVLGRGGMGVVCRVARDDHFEMQAALKLVPRGRGDAASRQRFERERQVLAGLEHPDIARLLDGGVANDGTPYLVMELVDGLPIDRWCEREELGPRERVELVLRVCDAVAAAHRALVVHRDLKPGNVLVDRAGRVRLLDFGVAAMIDPSAEDHDTVAPLTPDAAAPEQLRGDSVGTDTDVWALGLLLYRLLAGASPFRPHADGVADLLQSRMEPPSPPSTLARDAGRSPRWVRAARGDLDAVVLRAMAPHRSERYPSVEALAAELRAWLEGRPVEARPLPPPLELWRAVRRHAVASVSLLVAFLALAVGGAVALRQGHEAARERDRALAVQDFLAGLFRSADPFGDGSPDLTARELVERGSRELAAGFDGGDEVEARLADTLGWVWMGLGEIDTARDHFRRALALRVATVGASDPDTAAVRIGLAASLLRLGELGAAREEVERAVGDLRGHHRQEDLARALEVLGRLESTRGRHAAAAMAFAEAVELWRGSAESPNRDLARSLSQLAGQYDWLGRDEESIELDRRVLAMLRRIHGDEHPNVATLLNNLALKLSRAGRLAESVDLQRQALDIAARMTPDDPELTGKYTNLGKLLIDQGRLDEAAQLIEHAEERALEMLPPNAFTRIACEVNAATLDRERGRLDHARERYVSVLDRLRALVGDRHRAVARVQSLLAETERLAGRPLRAMQLFTQARAVQRDPAVPEAARSETLGGLGLTAMSLGRARLAAASLSDALALRREAAPEDDWRTLEYAAAAAALHGDDVAARTALDQLADILGTDHPRVAWLETTLDALSATRPAEGGSQP